MKGLLIGDTINKEFLLRKKELIKAGHSALYFKFYHGDDTRITKEIINDIFNGNKQMIEEADFVVLINSNDTISPTVIEYVRYTRFLEKKVYVVYPDKLIDSMMEYNIETVSGIWCGAFDYFDLIAGPLERRIR